MTSLSGLVLSLFRVRCRIVLSFLHRSLLHLLFLPLPRFCCPNGETAERVRATRITLRVVGSMYPFPCLLPLSLFHPPPSPLPSLSFAFTSRTCKSSPVVFFSESVSLPPSASRVCHLILIRSRRRGRNRSKKSGIHFDRLGRSWEPLGTSWPSWRPLGPSWRPLGPSWGGLGGLVDRLRASEARKGEKAKNIEKTNENQ